MIIYTRQLSALTLHQLFSKHCKITVAFFLFAFSGIASSSMITNMYVFGDSLSDTGALTYLSPENCPPPPYSDCKFSNGPVWAELVADELGVSATTAYNGGTNWAIGGQRTDQVKDGQIASFLGLNGGSVDSDALYVIWAGGNDFLQNNPQGTYTTTNAVSNIVDSITNLANAGAVDFFIPNLPLLDAWAFSFNAQLASALNTMSMDLNIIQFDVFSSLFDITMNPGAFGFTNVTDPCLNGFSICDNPDEYLLWDAVHPTAAGHQAIADAALAALRVSSPSSLLLILLGLCVFAYSRSAKKQ